MPLAITIEEVALRRIDAWTNASRAIDSPNQKRAVAELLHLGGDLALHGGGLGGQRAGKDADPAGLDVAEPNGAHFTEGIALWISPLEAKSRGRLPLARSAPSCHTVS
jgi:hypothetical protein